MSFMDRIDSIRLRNYLARMKRNGMHLRAIDFIESQTKIVCPYKHEYQEGRNGSVQEEE